MQPALAPAPHPGQPQTQSPQQQQQQHHQQQQQQQSSPHQQHQQLSDPNKTNPNTAHPIAHDHAEQVLHEQLLAAQLQASGHAPPPPRPQPGVTLAQPVRDQHVNIDPAISGGVPTTGMIQAPTQQQQQPQQPQPQPQLQPQLQPDAGDQSSGDGRKSYGKRELSTSKRAAQNRAAQRAFRQRKEGYIRKLEDRVKDYEVMEENYKVLQAENYQLREYIIGLQSRLIDTQGDVPELPPNIDLSQPRPDPSAGAQLPVGTSPGQPDQMNTLNRIAVAGLGMRKHQHEEAAFLGNSNFPTKRVRTDGVDDSGAGQGDAMQVSKAEGTQSTPMAT